MEKDMNKLDPGQLESALSPRIWRSWFASTSLPVKAIREGFLDGCQDIGLKTNDRIELTAFDGFITLVVNEVTSHGIGFSTLTMKKRVQDFAAAVKPAHKKAPVKKKKKELPLSVMEFTLSKEERANGWTPEKMAEYLEATENVKAVYIEEQGKPEAADQA